MEVKCPPGFVYFVSNDAHLQHPDASVVLHLLRRPHTAELAKEEKLRRVLQGRLGQGFAMPEGEKTAFVDDMMAYLLRDWHRADFKPLRGHHH